MGLISPTLRLLAEGRTEITTNMIAEAERVDATARYEMPQHELMAMYLAQGMAQAQYSYQQQLGMANDPNPAHYYNPYGLLLAEWYQPMQYRPQPRCPYCGR